MPRHVVKTRIQNEQRVYEQTRDYVDETDSPQDSFGSSQSSFIYFDLWAACRKADKPDGPTWRVVPKSGFDHPGQANHGEPTYERFALSSLCEKI